MSVFDLDQQGFADSIAESRLAAAPPEERPSIFAGTARATGAGLMRGGARVGQFLGMAAAPLVKLAAGPAAFDDDFDRNVLDPYFKGVDEKLNSAVDFWTPDEHGLGAGARAIGGFSEMALPLMAAGGNPSLLIGAQEMGSATDLSRAGVDSGTAVGVGAAAGLSTAFGFKIPIIGKTLSQRLAAGAMGNLLVNVGTTAAQEQILKTRGYDEMAANYDPLDGEARAVDVLTGLAFGALYHLTAPSKLAGTAAVNDAKHYQVDAAPGIVSDVHASSTHQAAMDVAGEQMTVGDKVSAPEEVLGATFKPRPPRELPVPPELQALDVNRAEESVKAEAIAAEEGGYSVAEGELTDEQLAQFQGLRSDVRPDENVGGPGEGVPGESGNQNAGGSRSEPLKVYRGASRELSPEDFRLEALGHSTGHPSSGLGVFFSKAAEEAARYGKLSEHYLDVRNPKVVLVEDLPGFDSTADANTYRKQLEAEGYDGMVIDASHLGGPVNYVAFNHEQVKGVPKSDQQHVDLLKSLERFVERKRATNTVPMFEAYAKGATPDMDRLVARYVEKFKDELPEKIQRALASENVKDLETGETLNALEDSVRGGHIGQLRRLREEMQDTADDAANNAAPAARELPPDVIAARQYLEHADIQIPTGEVDADGNAVTRSGREAIREAEAEIAHAEENAKGYDAAVNCWLTRGPGAK